MELGIQYQSELQLDKVQRAGFSYLEIPYELLDSVEVEQITGVLVKAQNLTVDVLKEVLEKAGRFGAKYLLLDTQELAEAETLCDILESCIVDILEKEIEIYIENGYQTVGESYRNSIFSDAAVLAWLAAEFNKVCGRECFGVCLNVGYANLLGKNLRTMAEELAGCIRLVHVNDNDGISNQHQMPYTFAKGRGAQSSTDWYHLIGALLEQQFDGFMVFDVTGLFKRTPLPLQGAMLELLMKMGQDWHERFHIERMLNVPEKKLILFGAGGTTKNYLKRWGKKYPPIFLTDNNKKLWGSKCEGFPVKSPEAILEVPAEERNVVICNLHYDEIGEQLKNMGITYQCYRDDYYLWEGI